MEDHVKSLFVYRDNAELDDIFQTYGFCDSGVFAAGLARLFRLKIILFKYCDLPLHVACVCKSKIIDASGIHNIADVKKQLCHSVGMVSECTKVSVLIFDDIDKLHSLLHFNSEEIEPALPRIRYYAEQYRLFELLKFAA
jgi:hypothetical protein